MNEAILIYHPDHYSLILLRDIFKLTVKLCFSDQV